MEAYLFLPKSGESLFDYRIQYLLKRFSDTYLPGFQHITVNLMRKMYHTFIDNPSNRDVVMKIVAEIDAHTLTLAEHVYVARKPELDAAKARILVNAILDGPVEWPDSDKIAKHYDSMANTTNRFQDAAIDEDDDDGGMCEEIDDDIDDEIDEIDEVVGMARHVVEHLSDKKSLLKSMCVPILDATPRGSHGSSWIVHCV